MVFLNEVGKDADGSFRIVDGTCFNDFEGESSLLRSAQAKASPALRCYSVHHSRSGGSRSPGSLDHRSQGQLKTLAPHCGRSAPGSVRAFSTAL